MQTDIKLYKTTAKGIKLIAMSIPFIAIGLWVITESSSGSHNYWMGWFCTCFFGLGFLLGVFMAFDKRPQIILTANGIRSRSIKQEEIKWEQIHEAYTLSIYEQNFICLVTDETLKRPSGALQKSFNELLGAQQINLPTGALKIDNDELNRLINAFIHSDLPQRKKLIQTYKVEDADLSFSFLRKVIVYPLISLLLLTFTWLGKPEFIVVMIITGIAAFVARWRPDNQLVRKYASLITWFGFINLFLCFVSIKFSDHLTASVGHKLSTSLESYKKEHGAFPNDLHSISSTTDFNLPEKYFVDRIEYHTTGNTYTLEADWLFGRRLKYDVDKGEWR